MGKEQEYCSGLLPNLESIELSILSSFGFPGQKYASVVFDPIVIVPNRIHAVQSCVYLGFGCVSDFMTFPCVLCLILCV